VCTTQGGNLDNCYVLGIANNNPYPQGDAWEYGIFTNYLWEKMKDIYGTPYDLCFRTYIKERSRIKYEKTGEERQSTVANAEVYTNKFLYHQGESVDITFYNKGSTTVALGNGMPMFEIWKFTFLGFQWQDIYPDWVHPILIWIFAGASQTETWDQKDSDGNQVSWGIYRVDVPYYESEPPIFQEEALSQQIASDYFLILP